MNIKHIVSDSLRYPFSDWKKFLILGILVLITDMETFFLIGNPFSKINIVICLLVIEFNVGILVRGYTFKIVKSSLDYGVKLPKFDPWLNLFVKGIKVSIVTIVYLIPVILLIIVFVTLHPSNVGANPLIIIAYNALNFFQMLYDMAIHVQVGLWRFITIFYVILAIPFINIAIAHMAYNDSKIRAAFKFREILNKISNIGWKNFILWYIVIEFLFLVIYGATTIILTFLNLIMSIYPLGISILKFLCIMIVVPFVFMYFARAVALIYMSGDKWYLKCEKCGGYYEPHTGESPEDFEECECGGKLEYIEIEESKNYDITENEANDNVNHDKIKWRLVGIGAISSIIIYLIPLLPLILLNYTYFGDGIIITWSLAFLAPLIGGFLASYTCRGCGYKYGIMNSIMAIFVYNIVIFLLMYFYLNIGIDFGLYLFIPVFTEVLGIISGVLGIFLKNRFNK
jgi:hypothetical protein